MPTHYFVDSSATGTGSGDTPANAAINVTSLGASWTASTAWGNMVWVRRNWLVAGSDARSLAWGWPSSINSVNCNSHAVTHFIGWPNSGDPFYNERPIEAVSAGWDADAAHLWLYPTISYSGNIATNGLRAGVHLTNFTLVESPGVNGCSLIDIFGVANRTRIGNLAIMTRGFSNVQNARQVDHLLVCASASVSLIRTQAEFARKITIASSSYFSGYYPSTGQCMMMPNNTGNRIEEIVILSNSITTIMAVPDSRYQAPSLEIGRIRGVRPNVSAAGTTNTGGYGNQITVDDYYGDGPMIFGGLSSRGSVNYQSVSSETALFDGGAVGNVSQSSYAAGLSQDIGNWNGWRNELLPPVRQLVSVTSGIPCVIRLHFAVGNCGSLDHWNAGSRINLQAIDCNPIYCTITGSGIRPGSSGLWTGSLMNVDSYYMMYASFTPGETRAVMAEAFLPAQGNISSGNLLYSQHFEVDSQ